jgi:hypothetical protein
MNDAASGPGLRIVPVYDGMDPAAGPYFRPDHERIADPAERERVAAYMRDGIVVLRSTDHDPDAIEPGRGNVVPGSFRTDGAWVWNDALMYYVRVHGIAPPADFYAHVIARGYRCPRPGPEVHRQALRLLIPSSSLSERPGEPNLRQQLMVRHRPWPAGSVGFSFPTTGAKVVGGPGDAC